MKPHDKNVPAEIRALQRAMARGASAEAREDFARLERMMDARECLQPYELELVRDDMLPLQRWEHLRACVACQLMLDGARLPKEEDAAPVPIPPELFAAVDAGADAMLLSMPPGRTELRSRAPALALAAALLLCAGAGYMGLQPRPAEPLAARAIPDEGAAPTAAELFVRLKRIEPAGAATMAMEWPRSGFGTDGAAYLKVAQRLKDQGAWGDAALALCIADSLSKNDPVLAGQINVVVKELSEAADVRGK